MARRIWSILEDKNLINDSRKRLTAREKQKARDFRKNI